MFNANPKGFSIKFKNGITASVQFGANNYCENRHRNTPRFPCENAEVMAWDENDQTIQEPIGWQSAEEVLAFLNDMANR